MQSFPSTVPFSFLVPLIHSPPFFVMKHTGLAVYLATAHQILRAAINAAALQD